MAAPYLNSYVAPFKPLSNITPFTYKDGATYLNILEGMRKYINDDLVNFVNTNFTALGDDFETQVNLLIDNVNAAIEGLIGEDAEINDPVVAAIINDAESMSRGALDALYADQFTDALLAAAVVAGATKTALDAAYAGQVTDAAVAGRIDDALTSAAILTLTSGYAGQVTDAAVAAVLDEALSKALLDANYAAKAYVDGILTDDGILVPIFGTSTLPDPTGLPDGLMAFNGETGSLVVIVAEAWTEVGGAGGGFEIPAWGYISIGNNPTDPSSSWPAITIGNDAVNDAPVSIAIGDSTEILGGGSGANGIAVGYGATVGAVGEAHGGGIAIGNDSEVIKTGGSGFAGVAIGASAKVNGTYAVALGGGAEALADESVMIGPYGSAEADSAIAIGNNANASGVDSIAIGRSATASGENSVQIGNGSNSDDDTFSIGQETFKMPGLELSVESSYIPVLNGGLIGAFVRSEAPNDVTALTVGVSYFDSTEGKPLWLKTIEVDPADNVWVDAAGVTVYPAP